MTARTINLTVIGDRACSTTRTYLHYLQAAGLRPRNLWLIDFGKVPYLVRVGRSFMGATAARLLNRPRSQVSYRSEFRELCHAVQECAGLPVIDHFHDQDYFGAAEEIDEFPAEDFNDGYLRRRMLAVRDSAFLYTNGGRVPARLLETPGVRVFHIHPGIVPDMRGSDCFIWSCAVRGRVGVSCFYMSAGIDEGQVISQAEYDVPDFSAFRPWLTWRGEDTAYRALLYAVDPHYRARLFTSVLSEHEGEDLRALSARPQPSASRPAYLWIHPRLRIGLMRQISA